MKVLTLDFETYYDTAEGYTLRKLSTEDYVCDPRFEVIGVGALIDNVSAGWFSGTMNETAEWLQQFDIENMALVGHHLMFDGLILAEHFNRYPAFYACTESMVRPFLKPILRSLSLKSVAAHLGLGEKGDDVLRADGKHRIDFTPEELRIYLEDYCLNGDCRLTRDVYLWARPQLTSIEMRIIDMTLRMYTQPILALDAGVYETGLREVRERKAKIIAEMEVQGITGKMLRSNQQFAGLLRARGIEPPMKDSPTSVKNGDNPPKRIFAFGKGDPEFIALREEFCEDLEVTTLINARISENGSIEETRNETLLDIARRYGKYRVPLSYYAAHTGRYAGKRKEDQ